jgi:CBS domain containing-hemolysin-like protein
MTTVLLELTVIFVLLVANGVFSMAEIAIVSSRKAKLRSLADAGDTHARLALSLAESPNTFLATVQVGITLVGVLAAATVIWITGLIDDIRDVSAPGKVAGLVIAEPLVRHRTGDGAVTGQGQWCCPCR